MSGGPRKGGSRGKKTAGLKDALLDWYRRSKRDLPWRRTRDPYAIWLSEVMLQQTRVDTVVPYYRRFLSAYPSVHALAEAPLEQVLQLWSGLGYYRRARMLHAAARDVDRHRGGALPKSAVELRSIQGIGRYTAGAIASIAWGEAVPVVDGNVARVLSRLFAVDGDSGPAPDKHLWELAGSLVAAEDPSSWNQALMELGATVCLPKKPRCDGCPVRAHCKARARGLEEELPRSRPKKAPTVVHRVGFVLRSRGRVLLGRRREDGLFAGMWEPPHADERDAGELGKDLTRKTKGRVKSAGCVTHVLSHRRIEMTVYAGPSSEAASREVRPALRDYDALVWVLEKDIATLPLSRLAHKILARGGGREEVRLR
jgi:A/G-specific adenine glycosylase